MMSPYDLDAMRAEMVSRQIEGRGIHDSRLLEALKRVPRHLFVPGEYLAFAYDDGPLPIGHGQTISQPYIVALMTDLLQLMGDESVLEIGTGSGYQAAVLSGLCRCVHTVERHAGLAQAAQKTIDVLGLSNVHLHCADGSLGWPPAAPYQAALVTAAAPRPPAPILDQLDDGGRLVIPIGPRSLQELEVWRKNGREFSREVVLSVAFVPLRGSCGWDEVSWPDYTDWNT